MNPLAAHRRVAVVLSLLAVPACDDLECPPRTMRCTTVGVEECVEDESSACSLGFAPEKASWRVILPCKQGRECTGPTDGGIFECVDPQSGLRTEAKSQSPRCSGF